MMRFPTACAIALTTLCVPVTAGAYADQALLARGDYLVNSVVGCGHCHSPRDAGGRKIPGRELTGGVMQYAPIKPIPTWAPRAPSIAGLPAGYTVKDMQVFMETGRKPNGSKARPPMPPFQLKPEDARAIAAYLDSLKPAGAR
ncbi:MAG: c-type cytochrome [Pseudomonadota bacterium]